MALLAVLGAFASKASAAEPVPLDFAGQAAARRTSAWREPSVRYLQEWETVLSKRDPFLRRVFEYLDTNKVYFDQMTLHLIDNREGFLAPVQRTPDGGVIVFGHRHKGKSKRVTIPYVLKLDANLEKQWDRYLEKDGHGFTDYESGFGAICPDGGGYVAMMRPYVHPGNDPVPWLLWLDDKGTVRRDAVLPGRGTAGTPVVGSALRNAKCGVQLEGVITLTPQERQKDIRHRWYARYNSRGALLQDSVDVTEP